MVDDVLDAGFHAFQAAEVEGGGGAEDCGGDFVAVVPELDVGVHFIVARGEEIGVGVELFASAHGGVVVEVGMSLQGFEFFVIQNGIVVGDAQDEGAAVG